MVTLYNSSITYCKTLIRLSNIGFSMVYINTVNLPALCFLTSYDKINTFRSLQKLKWIGNFFKTSSYCTRYNQKIKRLITFSSFNDSSVVKCSDQSVSCIWRTVFKYSDLWIQLLYRCLWFHKNAILLLMYIKREWLFEGHS